jgi:hypothetical protein
MHKRDTSWSPRKPVRPRRTLQWARSPETLMLYAPTALSIGLLRVSRAKGSAHPDLYRASCLYDAYPASGTTKALTPILDRLDRATGGCIQYHPLRWIRISAASACYVQFQSPVFSHFSHVCRHCGPEPPRPRASDGDPPRSRAGASGLMEDAQLCHYGALELSSQ